MAISEGLALAAWPRAAAWLDRLAEAGVDTVQVREKGLPDAELAELSERVRQRLGAGFTVLVNGRADVALAAGCSGVHLPSDGVGAAALRRRFGAGLVIGVSTHRPEEVEAARRAGADYVTFGPVFPTPSKAAYGPPPGLEGLRRAAAVGLPVLALGGVEADRLEAIAAAGAAGAAGIGAFHDPARLRRLAAAGHRLWPA